MMYMSLFMKYFCILYSAINFQKLIKINKLQNKSNDGKYTWREETCVIPNDFPLMKLVSLQLG